MSDGEATFIPRYAYPQYLQRMREQVVRLPIYRGQSLSAPSSGTYTLLDPRGTSLQSQAVAIVDKVAQTTLTAAQLPVTLALGYRYRERWTLALSDGTTRDFWRDVVITLHQIQPVVTDQDMGALYRDLREQLACDNKGFDDKRTEAWKEIVGRLEEAGDTPHLIMDAWRLRKPHLHLALALTFEDFWGCQPTQKWKDLSDRHRAMYEAAWRKLTFSYDLDQDGVDEGHQRAAEGVLYTVEPPPYCGDRRGGWA